MGKQKKSKGYMQKAGFEVGKDFHNTLSNILHKGRIFLF
jgi:hypothetical protein